MIESPVNLTSGWQDSLAKAIKPFNLFIFIYFSFYSILLTNVSNFTYLELYNLGTEIIGFKPEAFTTWLYITGGAFAIIGYLWGNHYTPRKIMKNVDSISVSLAQKLKQSLYSSYVYNKINSISIDKENKAFLVLLWIYLLFLLANGLAIVQVGSIPLFNISARWDLSAVLVWFASWQTLAVPVIYISANNTKTRTIAFACFFISLLFLGLLGARNLPIKLFFSFFFTLIFTINPRSIIKAVIAFFVIFILVLGSIGAISKSGIYGPKASAKLAVALLYSDSLSTVYTLERITNIAGMSGVYKGDLLLNSLYSTIPGTSNEYSSYEIGRMLQGRSYFVFGKKIVNRSVSLAPTIIGGAYADFGVLGVFAQMLLVGLLAGKLCARTVSTKWFIPFAGTYLGYLVVNIDAGLFNPHFFTMVGVCLLAILIHSIQTNVTIKEKNEID